MRKRSAEIARVLMSQAEARETVAKINEHLTSARKLIFDLHEREGWKALGYASWRECVLAEFEESQSSLYRELNAAKIEAIISPMGEIGTIPERQLRPLAPLHDRPDLVKRAWSVADEQTGGHATAKAVQAAVDEVTGNPATYKALNYTVVPQPKGPPEAVHCRVEESSEPPPKMVYIRTVEEQADDGSRFVRVGPVTEGDDTGDEDVRTAETDIRSTPEWKEWLGRFADARRKDVSDLIAEALVRMARGEGFEMPPKR